MDGKWYGQYCESEDVCPACLDVSVDYRLNSYETVKIHKVDDSRLPEIVDVIDICEFCRPVRDTVTEYLNLITHLILNSTRALETTHDTVGYQQSLVDSYDPTTSIEFQFQASPPNHSDSVYIEFTRFSSGALLTHSEIPFEFIYDEADVPDESELIPRFDEYNWKVNHTPNSLIYAL